MWILVRLSVLVIVFIARWSYRASPPDTVRTLDGRAAHLEVTRRSKSREIARFAIGVSLPARLLLSISREDQADRILKRLGLCREIETGDQAFDCMVYVACDHPELHDLLVADGGARAAIRAVFEAGFSRIRHDGAVLWIERETEHLPSDADWEVLRALAAALPDLEQRCSRRRTRYTTRAILCESTATAIGGFGFVNMFPAVGSMEWTIGGTLALYGVVSAVVAFLIVEGAVLLLLRGSSRMRLVLIESAALCVFGLPWIGIQSVADINARAGAVTSTEVTYTVAGKEMVRSRRSRWYYAIVHQEGPAEPALSLARVKITAAIYDQAMPGDRLHLNIARGSLGIEWVAEMGLEPGKR